MKIESQRGTAGFRKAIRRGLAEEEVCKHRDRVSLETDQQTKTTSRCMTS